MRRMRKKQQKKKIYSVISLVALSLVGLGIETIRSKSISAYENKNEQETSTKSVEPNDDELKQALNLLEGSKVGVPSSKRLEIAFPNNVQVAADYVNYQLFVYSEEVKATDLNNQEAVTNLIKTKLNLEAFNKNNPDQKYAVRVDSTTISSTAGNYLMDISVLDGANNVISSKKQIKIKVVGAELRLPFYTVNRYGDFELGTVSPVNGVFATGLILTTSITSDIGLEWVADEEGTPTVPINRYNAEKPGFHWGYVRVFDRKFGGVWQVSKVPVTVTNENVKTVENKVGVEKGTLLYKQSEVATLNPEQLNDYLNETLEISAWDLTNGEKLETNVTSTSLNNSGRTIVNIDITINGETVKDQQEVLVVPDEVFSDSLVKDWKTVDFKDENAKLINHFNDSVIGFPQRGINTNLNAGDSEIGFDIRDSEGKGYTFQNSKVADVPGVNGNVLYRGTTWERPAAIGYGDSLSKMTSKYFFRKGDLLKELVYDSENQILYAYELSISRNLNFKIYLNMYNLSNVTKSFAMLQQVDTFVGTDTVPMYSLGNNSGFVMSSSGKRFSIKLKDSRGKWLGEYKQYKAELYKGLNTNYFNNDFSKTGDEIRNIPAGGLLFSGSDSSYELGAKWRDVKADNALKLGYEVFSGTELDYMQIKLTPPEVNVYENYADDFKSDLNLIKIHGEDEHGTIYITYPNGTEGKLPFTGANDRDFNGKLVIPRETFPASLNEVPGSIKEYTVPLMAINETENSQYYGFPSEEGQSFLKVNAYKLGATPLLQRVARGSTWNKEASELVKDPIILPGNTPKYDYVDAENPVNTSIVGVTTAKVRMTDANDPEQKIIIEVPVIVDDGTLPTTGVLLNTFDFKTTKQEVADLDGDELNKLILNNSRARAYDLSTGLSNGVTLSVVQTTLTNTPTIGDVYTAEILAKKGALEDRKTVNIRIAPTEATLTVNFVNEKGAAIPEIDPVKIIGNVDSEVDITKNAKVLEALEVIEEKGYVLETAPENAEAVRIEENGTTVQYAFKGTVAITEAPDKLDFGTETISRQSTIRINKVAYSIPFIVSDTRVEKKPWTLSAKISKPLKNASGKQLLNAIRYKNSGKDEVVLNDELQELVTTSNTETSFNLSSTWGDTEGSPGFKFELPTVNLTEIGDYSGTIEYTLENAFTP